MEKKEGEGRNGENRKGRGRGQKKLGLNLIIYAFHLSSPTPHLEGIYNQVAPKYCARGKISDSQLSQLQHNVNFRPFDNYKHYFHHFKHDSTILTTFNHDVNLSPLDRVVTCLLSIELDGAVWVVKPLLDDGGEFADALAFFSQHVLSPRRQNDDLGAGWRHAHLV